ncbi:MAG: DUF1028 domain-containing protein [Beijerinckiaceae bacterium]|nr:DUF1028 domain-containing protein [Beijerinckiaceae bacterium]
MSELNTFSIVARCERTGMLGVAVSTAVPAVGAVCPYIEAGVGAVSTQSWVNPYLAIEALKLMRDGHSGPDALAKVIEADPGRDVRQIGIVDATGRAAAYTGSSCTDWCGQIVETNVSIQGNMLVGAATLEAMADAFRESVALGLDERLLLALEAGQAAGGDKRGKQSASLKIYHEEAYAWLDLRADEHRHPVSELRRIHAIAKLQLRPFIDGMPKRNEAAGPAPAEVSRLLALPPAYRPGGSGGA